MFKALILFLEGPILFLVPLIDDVQSRGKFIDTLILDFKASFEYLVLDSSLAGALRSRGLSFRGITGLYFTFFRAFFVRLACLTCKGVFLLCLK